MQRLTRAATLKLGILKHSPARDRAETKRVFRRSGCVTSSTMVEQMGLENTTVAKVLMTKGKEEVGSWLWCRSDDTVHDAVKQVKFS